MQNNKKYRRLLGFSFLTVGVAVLFLLMANEKQVHHGSLFGFFALITAILGLLGLMGLLGKPTGQVVSLSETSWGPLDGEPIWASPKVVFPLATGILLTFGIFLSPAYLPWVIAVFLGVMALSAFRRPALLMLVVVSAIYLPQLGVFGLWDPWETHYGEVSREILARDDWISLWWAQDGWFWSKPIFIFWAEALTWSASGIAFLPDTNFDYSEWVLRLPVFIMSMGALFSVYALVSRVFERRSGVLAALTLATVPYFFFLSHQAITDMHFVANITIAVCILLLAFLEDPEREVKNYRIGRFYVSAQHGVIALLVSLTFPQILYLITRNVTMISGPLFAWHKDHFVSGSAENNGIPGNAAASNMRPFLDELWFQPISQAALWFIGLCILIWVLRRERRAQALYMHAFYVFCSLAFMSKGIPGVALPGLVALLYLLVFNRWSLMLQGRLRITLGMVTVLIVGMPWFVAMFIRHGRGFTNRLLIHDHINRLAAGVHGDTGSIEYFINQLGYGLFPWIGLVPAALAIWMFWRSDRQTESKNERERRELVLILGLWFAATFTLFSAMITKFHHYIFPATPPAAILIGLLIDRMMGDRLESVSLREKSLIIGSAMLAPILWIIGIASLVGDIRGVLPDNIKTAERAEWVFEHPESSIVAILCLLLGTICAFVSARIFSKSTTDTQTSEKDKYRATVFSACLISGAMICAFAGRDMSWKANTKPLGFERLIHLFVYNYKRPWPEQFDYRPILIGFALVASACILIAAIHRLRPLMAYAILSTSLMFSFWCLNIYMVDLSPHWGQRELMKRYYKERKGPEEPLVAWQMNWKGENYYTGNRVSVFTSLNNDQIKDWITKHKGKRAFFVLEHTRLSRFRGVLAGKKIHEVTNMHDCNKFILVSAIL